MGAWLLACFPQLLVGWVVGAGVQRFCSWSYFSLGSANFGRNSTIWMKFGLGTADIHSSRHLPLFLRALQPVRAVRVLFSPFSPFPPTTASSSKSACEGALTPGVLLQHAATRAEQQGGGHGGRLPDPSASARARRYLSGTTWPQTMPILPWTRMPCAPATCMC